MEYGDDDDWDANELEALEEEAVNTYAATQQRQTQGPSVGRRTGLQEGTPPDSLGDWNLETLLKEKQQYEKLARDKQGELLILKSNIARATAEHANVLDTLNQANNSTREDLKAQLQAYKDRVARLETDLKFQRQELKESKLKGLQNAHSESAQLSQNTAQAGLSLKTHVFPSKVAFEREDSREIRRPTPLSTKKRKRNTRQSTDDHALDDFDLAEERSQQAMEKTRMATVRQQSVVYEDSIPLPPMSPQLADESLMVDQASSASGNAFGEKMVLEKRTAVRSPDKIMVYNELLGASMADGSGCITSLASIAPGDMSAKDICKQSLGQVILNLLSNKATAITGEEVTLDIARYLVGQLVAYQANTEVELVIIRLLRSTLSLFPKAVSSDLVKLSEVESPRALLATLQDLAERSLASDLGQAAMSLVLAVAEALDRDDELCTAAQGQFRESFYKTMLTTSQDLRLRTLTLQILSGLAGRSGNVQYYPALLDYISVSFDKDDFSTVEQLELRTVVAQCLYCITISQSGLDQVRNSRHVVPRLIRRISRELDVMHESTRPSRSLLLIQMLVKLYYILMKDESNATSAQHWRTLEIKAAHLTGMTRIVYAEDYDGFDNATQDLAMDLLELAVSPEEGNDIWEIMGGV